MLSSQLRARAPAENTLSHTLLPTSVVQATSVATSLSEGRVALHKLVQAGEQIQHWPKIFTAQTTPTMRQNQNARHVPTGKQHSAFNNRAAIEALLGSAWNLEHDQAHPKSVSSPIGLCLDSVGPIDRDILRDTIKSFAKNALLAGVQRVVQQAASLNTADALRHTREDLMNQQSKWQCHFALSPPRTVQGQSHAQTIAKTVDEAFMDEIGKLDVLQHRQHLFSVPQMTQVLAEFRRLDQQSFAQLLDMTFQVKEQAMTGEPFAALASLDIVKQDLMTAKLMNAFEQECHDFRDEKASVLLKKPQELLLFLVERITDPKSKITPLATNVLLLLAQEALLRDVESESVLTTEEAVSIRLRQQQPEFALLVQQYIHPDDQVINEKQQGCASSNDWQQTYSKTKMNATERSAKLSWINQRCEQLTSTLGQKIVPRLHSPLYKRVNFVKTEIIQGTHQQLDNQIIGFSRTLPEVHDPRRQNPYTPVLLSRAYALADGASLSEIFADAPLREKLLQALDARSQQPISPKILDAQELYRSLVQPRLDLEAPKIAKRDTEENTQHDNEQKKDETPAPGALVSALDPLLPTTIDLHQLAGLFVSSNETASPEEGLLHTWTHLRKALAQASEQGTLWHVHSQQWRVQILPLLLGCVQQLTTSSVYKNAQGNSIHDGIRAELEDYLNALNAAGQKHGIEIRALVVECLTLSQPYFGADQSVFQVQQKLLKGLQALTSEARTLDSFIQNIAHAHQFEAQTSSPLLKLSKTAAENELALKGCANLASAIRIIEDQSQDLATLNLCLDIAQHLSNCSERGIQMSEAQITGLAQQLGAQLSKLTLVEADAQPTWQCVGRETKLHHLSKSLHELWRDGEGFDARSTLFSELCKTAPEQILWLKPPHWVESGEVNLNLDYCYSYTDVNEILTEIHQQLAPDQRDAVRIQPQALALENKKIHNGVVDLISEWASHKPTNALCIVPYIPVEQGQIGGDVLHWTGVVASANDKGKIQLVCLDPLFHMGNKDQNSWQRQLQEGLSKRRVQLEPHSIKMQQQTNTSLCGPMLCHSLEYVIKHWSKARTQQRLPPLIPQTQPAAIRKAHCDLLTQRESFESSNPQVQHQFKRAPFIYRQQFSFT